MTTTYLRHCICREERRDWSRSRAASSTEWLRCSIQGFPSSNLNCQSFGNKSRQTTSSWKKWNFGKGGGGRRWWCFWSQFWTSSTNWQIVTCRQILPLCCFFTWLSGVLVWKKPQTNLAKRRSAQSDNECFCGAQSTFWKVCQQVVSFLPNWQWSSRHHASAAINSCVCFQQNRSHVQKNARICFQRRDVHCR